MSDNTFTIAKRAAAVVVAVALWWASVKFSVAGLGFEMDGYAWLGYLMAVSVTVLELVFNSQPANLTLFAAGLLAYAYSIYTNYVGILAAKGGAAGVIAIANHPLSHIGQLMFAITLAAFLDVVPEPLLIWGLRGDAGARESDPLGAMLAGAPRPQRPKYHRTTPPKGHVRGA